jgi:hypothetical protein
MKTRENYLHLLPHYSLRFISIIRFGEDGLGQGLADLGNNNVNAECEFDVMDMVASQVNVHQAWNAGVIGCIFVVMHTLDERGGTVPTPMIATRTFFCSWMKISFFVEVEFVETTSLAWPPGQAVVLGIKTNG